MDVNQINMVVCICYGDSSYYIQKVNFEVVITCIIMACIYLSASVVSACWM